MGKAAQRWRDQLAEWAIPDRITSAVAESPWVLPTDVFARRADRYLAEPSGPSWQRAVEALAPRGSVLDVGAGAGAASLPLAPMTRELFAVDSSESMLAALTERAARLGLSTRTIVGRWPDSAASVPTADVVVCHHVWYNAPDLDAFAAALHRHAGRRVVVELTVGHPLRVLSPLWKALHDLDRPTGPTAADAVAVLREIGIQPHEERWRRPPRPEYGSFAEMISITRRRLCLPPDRDDELAELLINLGVDPAHPRDLDSPATNLAGPGIGAGSVSTEPAGSSADDVVTLWWDVRGPA